ncbi:MAG: type II toxin-antitoxin system RelE/ParE family toxin [Magnetococcales bacterium]|nr:type II toxin-antitoxin system RelE/ParE family toxin [Magnetococcales bacterium]MBF0322939.1 type II toxin-antitoxin system RelE/ParE family toxin [Magnetococcales bacterium]
MNNEPVTLVELPEFQKRAAVLLNENQLNELKIFLAFNPEEGNLILGTGGIRKLRWAVRDQGKRGGARVIYYYQDVRYPILLLTLFAKNTKTDLTQAQRNELRGFVEAIKRTRSKS